MDDPKCGDCRFFQLQKGYETQGGQCRRYPPTVVGTSVESERWGRQTEWDQATPYVPVDGWCGEHSPVGEQ